MQVSEEAFYYSYYDDLLALPPAEEGGRVAAGMMDILCFIINTQRRYIYLHHKNVLKT